MELVAVPSARVAPPHAGRLVDAELREPLADQVEVVLVPVRANTCGSFDVNAISRVMDPPGGTASGSVALITV